MITFDRSVQALRRTFTYLCTVILSLMKLKIAFLAALFLPFISSAQSDPTLLSYKVDTLCEDTYGVAVYDILIEDMDNDDTYVSVVSYDNLLINEAYGISLDTYDPGV